MPNQSLLIGIHAEGPLIATLGGLPASQNSWSVEEFQQLVNLMLPALKIMTISPSVEKMHNYEHLEVLLKHKVRAALGHDVSADEASIIGCLQLAAKYESQLHVTHLFNVSSFHHRNISLCNIGLLGSFPPGLKQYHGLQPPSVEVIGDFVHVHPLTVQLAIQCRENHLAFVTDAIMEKGDTQTVTYCSRAIHILEKDQKHMVVLKENQTIAGSCTSMLQIFHHLVKELQLPVPTAVSMLSEIPARIAGVEKLIGSLQPGKRADILLFDDQFVLQKTIVAGQVVFFC